MAQKTNIDSKEAAIDPQTLYTFKAFKALTGVGPAGLREARKAGLRVRYFGRSGYVLGADIIAHILKFGNETR